MKRHEICSTTDLQPGERKVIEIGKRSIGVFNVHGTYYAVRNVCPHQGAELCKGTVGGTMLPTDQPGQYNYAMDGQVLRCPWHFWEFDITTGEMIVVPEPLRVKVYDVTVEKSNQKPVLERYEVGIEKEMIVLYL